MICPIPPSDFEELIPAEGDSLCEKLKKAISFQRKFVDWYACFFDENGNLSDATIEYFCTNGCSSSSGTSTATTGAPVENENFDDTDGEEVDYVVGAGVTSLHYRLWGAGGGGGGGANYPLAPAGTPQYAGGGGGGGGFIEGDLSVTPGETLKFRTGGGGTAGAITGGPGGNGFAGGAGTSCYIKRSATILVEAYGGSGGGGGTSSATGVGGTGGSSTYTPASSSSVNQVIGTSGLSGISSSGGAGGAASQGGAGGSAGQTGSVPGGAGGGGNGQQAGGAGGNGRISIS